MAGPYFWVGGTGNWSDATNHWATSSGGAPSVANVPTSTDNVTFDANSNATAYTVTVDAAASCQNMSWALPGTSGVPTLAGSSTLGVYGSLLNIATMLWTYTGQLTFRATTTGKTITSAGVTYVCPITFNGTGGGWTLQDALLLPTKQMNITEGTFDTGANRAVECISFASTSNSPRTINFNSSTFTCHGAFSMNGASLTPSVASSTLNYYDLTGGGTNSAITISSLVTLGTVTLDMQSGAPNSGFNRISINGGGSAFKVGALTLLNTDGAKIANFLLSDNLTVSGTLTVTGNSATSRILLSSDTLGTQRTVTAAVAVLTNLDFQDILGAGAATWSGTSVGDALGNSGVTFTTPAPQTFVGGTKNWSDVTAWTSRVPLPQDSVIVNTTTAGTLSADMPRLGKDIDFTSFTRTLSITPFNPVVFGSLTLSSSGMTISGAQTVVLQGRGSHTIACGTLTQAGQPHQIDIESVGGTYTAQDALRTNSTLTVGWGTFNANNFDVYALRLTSNSGNTRAINMGSGRWNMGGPSAAAWTTTASGLTLTPGASTIDWQTQGASTATFAGGGLTYNNFYWSTNSDTGILVLTGNNTFNNFRVDGTTARTVQFPSSGTKTLSSLTMSGADSSHLISITSSTPGAPATLSKASGSVAVSFASIKDSTATGGATFRAGATSTNVSGNSGWLFTTSAVAQAPSVSSPESLSMRRNMTRLVGLSSPEVVSTSRSMSHRVPSISLPEVVTSSARKTKPGGSVVLSMGQLVTLSRRKLFQIISVTMGNVATLSRRKLFQVITVTVGTVVSLTRHKTAVSAMVMVNPMVLSFTRRPVKYLFAHTGLTVQLSRPTANKLFKVSWPQHIFINAPRERRISIAQSQLVRLIRGMCHRTSLVLAQVVTLRRRVGHRVTVSQPEQVTLRRSMRRTLLVRQAEQVTLARRSGRTLLVVMPEQVQVTRRTGHRINLTTGQVVTVLRQAVHKLSKLITVSIPQVVTTRRNRGKTAKAAQAQLVTLRRNVFKTIRVSLAQLVILFPRPIVRLLNPSLFSFGLFRHRIVTEVPNVAATNILEPPIEAVVEQENVEFDYGLVLADGVKLLSAIVTCTAYSGTDPNPETRLISYPVVATSTRTGKSSQAIRQTVGSMLDGVTYRLQCVATTDDGQVLALVTLLSSEVSL